MIYLVFMLALTIYGSHLYKGRKYKQVNIMILLIMLLMLEWKLNIIIELLKSF